MTPTQEKKMRYLLMLLIVLWTGCSQESAHALQARGALAERVEPDGRISYLIPGPNGPTWVTWTCCTGYDVDGVFVEGCWWVGTDESAITVAFTEWGNDPVDPHLVMPTEIVCGPGDNEPYDVGGDSTPSAPIGSDLDISPAGPLGPPGYDDPDLRWRCSERYVGYLGGVPVVFELHPKIVHAKAVTFVPGQSAVEQYVKWHFDTFGMWVGHVPYSWWDCDRAPDLADPPLP